MELTYKIPEGSYVGYYWMSDATDPEVIPDEKNDKENKWRSTLNELLSKPAANPFVIEAQLYDSTNKRSFSIKYVDGKYSFKDYSLGSLDEDCKIVEKSYVANRMPGLKLLFRQYWRPIEDEYCNNMKVLQPAEMVFVGFKQIENKDSYGKQNIS